MNSKNNQKGGEEEEEYVPLFHYRGSLEQNIDLLEDLKDDDDIDDDMAFREFNQPTKKLKRGKKPTNPYSSTPSRSAKKKKRADFDGDIVDNSSEALAQQAYESQFNVDQATDSTTLQRSSTTPLKTSSKKKQKQSQQKSISTSSIPTLSHNNIISLDEDDYTPTYTPSSSTLSNTTTTMTTTTTTTTTAPTNIIGIDDDDDDIVVMGGGSNSNNNNNNNIVYDNIDDDDNHISYIGSSSPIRASIQQTQQPTNNPLITSIPYNSLINLTFKLVGEDNMTLQAPYDTPIKPLVDIYCHKKQLDPESVQLKLYGLTLAHTKSPRELELTDGDEVSITFKDMDAPPTSQLLQSLSSPSLSSSSLFPLSSSISTTTTSTTDDSIPKIVLRVRYNGNTHKFKIASSDPLEKLVNALMKKENIAEKDKSKVVLKFDGLPLKLAQTPEDEDMEDDDLIDAICKL